MAGDTFHMSGDFRGANVVIKSTLTNLDQSTRNMPGADEAARDELRALVERLNKVLQRAPVDKREEAEAVAQQAERLIEAAKGEQPNRTLLRDAADGLRQTAQTLAAAPAVLSIANQIADLIAKVRGL